MPHARSTDEIDRKISENKCTLALSEAVAGLQLIRDEGPDVEPAYPTHGGLEAYEAWAFDSASHERAQTAREALERVAAISKG